MLAKQLIKAVHIQTDLVRSMVAIRTYNKSESKFVYYSCILIAGNALKHGYNAIVDGTFTKEEYRREAREQLNGLYGRYFLVYVKCDPFVAIKRNTNRKAKVPESRLLGMYKNFEEPADSIVIDTTGTTVEESFDLLMKKLSSVE